MPVATASSSRLNRRSLRRRRMRRPTSCTGWCGGRAGADDCPVRGLCRETIGAGRSIRTGWGVVNELLLPCSRGARALWIANGCDLPPAGGERIRRPPPRHRPAYSACWEQEGRPPPPGAASVVAPHRPLQPLPEVPPRRPPDPLRARLQRSLLATCWRARPLPWLARLVACAPLMLDH